jgi:IclR family pca regulon transcriptional regulator
VLKVLNLEARPMTNAEVAERAGLTRATARRFLLTLTATGYLHYDGRHFRLSPRVMDLGTGYFNSRPVWEQAQPVMKRLVDEIDESCSLAVLDGADVVYLARVPPKHVMTIPISIGTRLPAFTNAMGRALLADLADDEIEALLQGSALTRYTDRTVLGAEQLRVILCEVRSKGYAIALHEMHEGRGAIAVAVRDRAGRVHGAINIAAMLSRVSEDRLTGDVLTRLQAAAREIGDGLALQST